MSETTSRRRLDPNDPAAWDEVRSTPSKRAPAAATPNATLTVTPEPAPADDPEAWKAVTTAKQEPPPSLLGYLGGRLGQGTAATLQGLLGGAYDLAAIPQNAVASLTGIEALRARPFAENLEQIGLPKQEPTMTNAIITGGASALPLMIGGPALAPTIRNPVGRAVATALGENKVAQVGGGVGAEVAHRFADDSTDNPVARFLAPFAGGLLGGGITVGIQAGVRALRSQFGSNMLDAARRYAATLAPQERRGFMDAIRNYRPETAPPGDALNSETARFGNLRTTAQVADDAGVESRAPHTIEKIVETKRDLLEGGARDEGGFYDRRLGAREARTNVLDLLTPNADPAAIRPALQAQADDAGTALQTATTALGPPVEPLPAGTALQTTFGTERARTSAEVGALREAIPPDTQVPVAGVRRAIQQAGEREFISQDPASAEWAPLSTTLARLSGERTLGFADLQKIRSAAMDQARAAYNSGNNAAGRALDATAESVRQALETGLPPAEAQQFGAFRTAARERGEQFGGPVADKMGGQEYGRPDVPAEKVPGMFFNKGEAGGASMREFGTLYRDANGNLLPDATTAIRGHVAEKVAALVDPTTGEVNPQALARFHANYRHALQAVPELGLDQSVANVRDAAVLASERGTANVRTLAEHQANVAQTVLGVENINDAVGTILRGRNPAAGVRDLMRRLDGNPNAQEGVRQAILHDWSQNSVTNQPLPGTDLTTLRQGGATKWWNNNQDALTAAFTPEERARLRAVHDSLFSEAKVQARASPTGSDTVSNLTNAELLADKALGAGPQTRGRAIASGLVDSMTNIPLVSGWAKRMQAQSAEAVMRDLYSLALDPEVFSSLLRRATPETFAELAGNATRRSGAVRGLQTLGGGLATTGRAALPGTGAAFGRGYRDEERRD